MELSIKYGDKVEMKKISAVFKPYVQAALQIDVLDGSLNLNEEGTACMILLKKRTNMKAFQERFEATELPTLLGKGYYRFQTLQDSYFDTELAESTNMGHRTKRISLDSSYLG